MSNILHEIEIASLVGSTTPPAIQAVHWAGEIHTQFGNNKLSDRATESLNFFFSLRGLMFNES